MTRILIQNILAGFGSGAVFALVALSFSIVYKGSKVINFALSEYVVLGGVLVSALTVTQKWPLALAALVAISVCIVLGLITEFVAFKFLRQSDPLIITIGTVGFGIALDALIVHYSGGNVFYLRSFSPQPYFHWHGFIISSQAIWNIGICIVTVVIVGLFYTKTRVGIGLQAAAEDFDTASSFGVSKRLSTMLTFGLGAAIAAIAGIATTPVTLMASTSAVQIGLGGFAAAMLGGLGTLSGAVIGGMVLGMAQVMFSAYISSSYSSLLAFGILLLVLFLRPNGLMGKGEVSRV